MKMRPLGRNGPHVSALGFGAMALSAGPGAPEDAQQAVDLLQQVVDLGVTFVVTADVYAGGRNERLVGRALEGRREQVVLATGFGGNVHEDGSPVMGLGRADAVRRALDASLQRLGVDAVDLWLLHRVDPLTEVEETVGAMADLVREGKVRHLGLGAVSGAMLRRAHAVHPITAVQVELSLLAREPEVDLLPVCRELGVGLVACSPLAQGLLTGRIRHAEDLAPDDWRRTLPRFQDDALARNAELVQALAHIAVREGVTSAQLALAWLLHQDPNLVPLTTSRSLAHVEEDARAADLVLDDRELGELQSVAELGAAPPGAPAPEALGRAAEGPPLPS